MPAPRYPAPLQAGARIVVTAPSSGVELALHPRLDRVLAHLRSQGFVVEEGQCLRDERDGASAPADVRTAELMRCLLRDDVHAIVPPWGGELAIELLDRLDWVALAPARPKWLLGYSDTSTLLLALTLRLGWATAHGPCLMDLVAGQRDLLTRGALDALRTPTGGTFTQRQSTAWQAHWGDFALTPDIAYALTQPTAWRPLRAGTHELAFAGRLIGGCLDTLAPIAASPHADLRGFIAAHARDGVVLYLENAELSPSGVVRALHTLRWAGWLDRLAGILIGRNAGTDATEPSQLRYDAALASVLDTLPCPVLLDADIGHRPPQLVLVNGALAQVHWSAADGATVVQQLA